MAQAYGGWLVGVLLLRRFRWWDVSSLRRFAAIGLAIAAALALPHPVLVLLTTAPIQLDAAFKIALLILCGGVAGVWYWLCVRWQPRRGAPATEEPAV